VTLTVVYLDELPIDADRWRVAKRALCDWQATGRAMLIVAGQPVDLVSVALAETADALPRPADAPPDARVEIRVYDAALASQLARLARDVRARRDGPPPDPPPPIGSQP
jgi:hypothetical protein